MKKEVLATLLLVLTTACAAGSPTTQPTSTIEPTLIPTFTIEPTSTQVQSVRVIDGDTVEIDGTVYRIVGIDAPEDDECGYESANEKLANILTGQHIEIETHGFDRYGRTLAHLTVDEKDVGYEMIHSGHAIAKYDSTDGYTEHKYQEEYHEATLNAQQNIRGVWHACHSFDAPCPTPTIQPTQEFMCPNNCTEARDMGMTGMTKDHPCYQSKMDRDGDGVACE